MKTLFCEAPGKVAVLVSMVRGRNKRKVLRFQNAQAALAWCEKKQICFIFMPSPQVDQN
jgi:hypothetical protein